MAIEIVDLPIKMVMFHSYVSLPESILMAKFHDFMQVMAMATSSSWLL
jgi:hypothetical protein